MLRRRIFPGGWIVASAMLLSACLDKGPSADETGFWTDVKPIQVAAGPARRGPWRMNASDFDYVDDATVAVTGDGHVGVAWVDQRQQEVSFQMYAPTGQARFSKPVQVSFTPGVFSWMPRMVISTDDPRLIYVLWQEIVFSGGSHGGEIFFARSHDGGATFSAPLNLSNSMAGDGKGRLTASRWDNGSLDLAAGPEGNLYAAWTEFEGRLLVSRSTDGGATFTEPMLLGDANRSARKPALSVDGGGVVYLAWSAGGLDAADIHITRSTDGGRTFGAPEVMVSKGHSDAPKLAVDGNGVLHLVYAESDGGQYEIRYARRDVSGDSFSEPRTIAAAGEGASANFPEIAVDGANRLYVVWEAYPEHSRHPNGLGFTMSRDGGQSFTAPEIVPQSDEPRHGFTGSLQGSFTSRIAVNPRGDIALVSSTFAPGRSSHIWLWRRRGNADQLPDVSR